MKGNRHRASNSGGNKNAELREAERKDRKKALALRRGVRNFIRSHHWGRFIMDYLNPEDVWRLTYKNNFK